MADEEENKPEGEESGETQKKASSLGPLLALVGVLIIGAVLVFGLVSLASGASTEEAEEKTTNDEHDGKNLLERSAMLDLGDIMANVKGEEGRRYVKVTVQLWHFKDKNDVAKEELRNILVQACEQRLGTFDMKQLNNDGVNTLLARGFEDQINKRLRYVLGTVGEDIDYIDEIVITNRLIQ